MGRDGSGSSDRGWIGRCGLDISRLIFGQRNFRPTIAVLGFKNQSGTPESDWVSDSLSEMLASELAAGDHVVPMPGESVSRMKLDLGLPDEASYAPETVERVQRRLHCDYLVYGAFFDPGKAAGGRVQLDLRLERAPTHEVLASVSESGTELTLPELAARVGATLRSRLGVPGISTSNSSELQAALPSTPDAQRQYFEGLRQLRSFDLLGARDSLNSATTADPNFSLAHAYLADAWQGLGYDDNAKQEARTGFELSAHLGREDKALVEARFREISSEWDKAIDLYRSLWTLYPENPEYAFRTSYVQIRAGKAAEAMGTIAELRKQMGAKNTDPRLDLKEAEQPKRFPISQRRSKRRHAPQMAHERMATGSSRRRRCGGVATPWLLWEKRPMRRRRASDPLSWQSPLTTWFSSHAASPFLVWLLALRATENRPSNYIVKRSNSRERSGRAVMLSEL